MILGNAKRYCSTKVRVRFAPSPTGKLHLGSLRTAVYNYLFAKKYDGKFILRIEDTDQSRLVPGAVEKLQADLKWAGIFVDEGPGINTSSLYGPYVQSERLKLYSDNVKTLLANDSAYHCFCTDRRLELLRRESARMGGIQRYDNRCRQLSKNDVQDRLNRCEKSCIRFKLTPGYHPFEDLITGCVNLDITLSEGDPVIMKSDGFPTYHFANVVDDHYMCVSHVLRGVEWQVSTPKHLMMYKAFDWTPPIYAHLPLLLTDTGQKFSKRMGDTSIEYYRGMGILPMTLINLAVSSGSGFTHFLYQGSDTKCYTWDELIQHFDVDQIQDHNSPLRLSLLQKINFSEVQCQMRSPNRQQLVDAVKVLVTKNIPQDLLIANMSDEYVRSVIIWANARIDTLSDLIGPNFQFLWTRPNYDTANLVDWQHWPLLVEHLESISFDSKQIINLYLKEFCSSRGLKFSRFMQSLRILLSGLKHGPGVPEIMVVLGKETVLQRFNEFFEKQALTTVHPN